MTLVKSLSVKWSKKVNIFVVSKKKKISEINFGVDEINERTPNKITMQYHFEMVIDDR